MPSKYKHLFFDLDHTLWDFESNAKECLAEMYLTYEIEAMGVPHFETFYQYFSIANHRYWAMLERKEITIDQLRRGRFKTAFANMDIEITEAFSLELTETFLALLPHKTQLIAGAIAVLDYLKPRYTLHIISNGFYEGQILKMKNGRIFDYFDTIITSEKAQALKPEKAIFDYALRSANASLSDSLMIGDNYVADIKGAMKAGLDTVFYNPQAQETIEQPTFDIVHLTALTTFL